jgi:hypothetical protein
MAFLLTFSGGASATYKDAVRVATGNPENIALTGSHSPTPLTIDTIALADKDRVLLRGQTNAAENGIYVYSVSGSNYTLTRSLDANNSNEVLPNMLVPVSDGFANADKIFQLVSPNVAPINLGVDLLTFTDVLIGLANKADRDLANLLPTSINQSLLFADDTSYNIGAAAASRPQTLYVKSAINLASLTASEILASDASKNVVSLSTATYPSLTELSYVKGVTSALQSQLDLKIDEATDTFYVNAPASIQSSINAIVGTRKRIQVSNGVYNENLTFSSQNTLQVVGPSTASGVDFARLDTGRSITISGTAERIHLYNLLADSLTINATTGRHYFRDMVFGSVVLQNAIQNFVVFQNCTFTGSVSIDANLLGVVVFNQCDFTGATFNSSAVVASQVQLLGCVGLPSLAPANAVLVTVNTAASGASQLNSTDAILSSLTASRALVSDANKKLVASAVSTTTLESLNSATAASTASTLVLRDASGESAFDGLSLDGSTSGAIKLQAAATTTPYTVKLPAAQGAANSVIQNDGSGNLSWVNLTTGVSAVTASAPVASSGGATPNISISQSGAAQDGYLSSTDWNTFNNKQAALSFGDLTSSDITVTGGVGAVIGSGTSLSLTKGNLSETTSSVLTISGGTSAVLGSGVTIAVAQAGSAQSGYLSSTDWSTFNAKQDALPAYSDDKVLYSTASAPEWRTVGTGSTSAAYPANTVILGRSKPASLTGTANTIIGDGAANVITTSTNNVLIGTNAANTLVNQGSNLVVIGSGALNRGSSSVTIGHNAGVNGDAANVVWIGANTGNVGNAINCIAIGREAKAGSNEFAVGSSTAQINTMLIGRGGASQTAANAVKIMTMRSSGTDTDMSVGTLTIAGAQGTGTGAGGDVIIATAPPAVSSGSSLNAHVERMRVTDDGDVGIGTATPGEKLEVAGNVLVSNHAVITQTLRARDGVGSAQHDILLRGGDGLTGNHDGGDVTIQGGLKHGTGADGELIFKVAGAEAAKISASNNLDLSCGLIVNSAHAQAGTADVITVADDDFYVGVDCSGAAKTVNLPTAAAGKKLVIKDESGDASTNNITVSGTIDGAANYVMAVDYEALTLVSDGTNWFII